MKTGITLFPAFAKASHKILCVPAGPNVAAGAAEGEQGIDAEDAALDSTVQPPEQHNEGKRRRENESGLLEGLHDDPHENSNQSPLGNSLIRARAAYLTRRGPGFDPASAPLGAGASRRPGSPTSRLCSLGWRIEQGWRRAPFFLARLKPCPFKAAGLGSCFPTSANTGQMWATHSFQARTRPPARRRDCLW